MRVLSAKLEMSDDFSVSDFFRIISKWLDNAGPCKIISERLKIATNKQIFMKNLNIVKRTVMFLINQTRCLTYLSWSKFFMSKLGIPK